MTAHNTITVAATAPTDPNKPNWDKLNPDIVHQGKHITLPGDPANMAVEDAITALQRKLADENQEFLFVENFEALPYDGAVAFVKAMRKLYGWSSPQTVMTFFGPKPPQMLSVKTGPGPDDVIQCPLGHFKLPGITNNVVSEFSMGPQGFAVFRIHCKAQKKNRDVLLNLAKVTREFLRDESIYRGKPFRLGVDDSGQLNLWSPPEFLDVSEMTEESILFDADIRSQIDTNVLVPLKATELCRQHKIPLKRGILLEGPYGTGKSLTARLAARVAEKNGWTFILLDKVQGLRIALEFANRYAPSVVFAEDIDRMAEHRDEATNDLVNIIDGVVSKKAEVMTVLTTNFVEKLDPVILRPGRLDAVISVRAPGPDTVKRLIQHYAGSLLDRNAPLDGAGHELQGQIPASIRECVERAKLGMIGRGDTKLADSDIVVAAKSMKNHMALLNKKPAEPSPGDKLAGALKQVLEQHLDSNGRDVLDMIPSMDSTVDGIYSHARRTHEIVEQLAKVAKVQ